MKLVFPLLLLAASCAHPDPVKGEFWLCHARSEHDESPSHREGHWATCQGVQYCAREEALKRCLWHHPADCVITKCQQIPELKGEPAAPEIKSVDEELKDLEPKS